MAVTSALWWHDLFSSSSGDRQDNGTAVHRVTMGSVALVACFRIRHFFLGFPVPAVTSRQDGIAMQGLS